MKKKLSRSRKRHFQLLELMVAAFILLVCIAPTMRIFTNMYLSQQNIIRENQRDHLAHMVHAQVTEMLYRRQIALEETPNKLIELKDPKLNTLLQKFSYQCEGTFTIVNYYTPRGQEHFTACLGKLIVKLKDVSPKAPTKIQRKIIENQDPRETFYDYYIYIDAGKKDDKNKNKNPSDKKSPNEKDPSKKNPLSPSSDTKDVDNWKAAPP